MGFLQHIMDQINALSPAMLASIAMAMEFLFRFIPTEKPKSILLGIKAFFNMIGALAGAINSLLDKILPQKLK